MIDEKLVKLVGNYLEELFRQNKHQEHTDRANLIHAFWPGSPYIQFVCYNNNKGVWEVEVKRDYLFLTTHNFIRKYYYEIGEDHMRKYLVRTL